jgi:hypothetical protein
VPTRQCQYLAVAGQHIDRSEHAELHGPHYICAGVPLGKRGVNSPDVEYAGAAG